MIYLNKFQRAQKDDRQFLRIMSNEEDYHLELLLDPGNGVVTLKNVEVFEKYRMLASLTFFSAGSRIDNFQALKIKIK